jgi:hypothetical protein
MKIITFVPSDHVLSPLIDQGIAEYYFGHIPPYWKRSYSLINSINRRYQFKGQEGSLKVIFDLLKRNWGFPVKFFLALNNHLYTQAQIESILIYFKELFRAGLDGVICADVGLMSALRERFPHLKIHVSLGAPIRFFEALGAERIILDRLVSVEEAAALRRKNRDIGLEAFVLQQGCLHSEGVCTHHHGRGCVCLANVHRFLSPKVDIGYENADPLFRLRSLAEAGVDHIKIPRLADRGATASEILKEYGGVIAFIRKLNDSAGRVVRRRSFL